MAATNHPSVVFERSGTPEPGTHVLIVGISTYPYLFDGPHEGLTVPERLGQLHTPSHSARALAEWFLDNFDNPTKPLASLALLLSEARPAKFTHSRCTRKAPVPQGTADDLIEAVDAWISRASSHRENLTVFFFCGHGVSSGESILLLRDFGRLENNAFDGALNLKDFVSAMQTKIPDEQLFLIDACRTPTSLAAQVHGKSHLGRTGLSPSDIDDRDGTPAQQSVHHATSLLSSAYGRTDSTSLYTDALIQALNGGGAQSDLRWWIGTGGLNTALGAYVSRLAKKESVTQVPQLLGSSRFKIHKPKEIKVPVYVTSCPKEAMNVARVEAVLGSVTKALYDYKVKPCEEWAAILEHREHKIVAHFSADSRYNDVNDVLVLAPPEFPYVLEPSVDP